MCFKGSTIYSLESYISSSLLNKSQQAPCCEALLALLQLNIRCERGSGFDRRVMHVSGFQFVLPGVSHW